MEVYPCPLCDREAGRTGPFTDPTQTENHITGAHDVNHAGEYGPTHREEIVEGATEVAEDDLPDPTDNDGTQREHTTVNGAGGLATLPDAVELHGEMLAEPEKFGIARGESVSGLADIVFAQRRMIAELYREVDEMADALAEADRLEHVSGAPDFSHRPDDIPTDDDTPGDPDADPPGPAEVMER